VSRTSVTWKTSIKTRILGILALLGTGYVLLLTMVQFTAADTHAHMDEVSSSLFPAALKMQEVEASFEQLRKRYKDAVLLEEPAALADADRQAATLSASLLDLRSRLAAFPTLASGDDALIVQFETLRDRSHQTYSAVLASRENVTDTLQARVVVLAADDKAFIAAMGSLDDSIATRFRGELQAVDSASVRSRAIGWALTLVAMFGCAVAWWVLHYNVLVPLEHLATRMQDIAHGDGDLTSRVDVRGSSELDEVGRWFNVFIARV
jgi:hypothetical protein